MTGYFRFGLLVVFISLTEEEEKFWKWIFYVILAIGVFLYSAGSRIVEKNKVQGVLGKEVNLHQVMVKGQNNFHAEIQIVYKDGKLDTVTLIPGTTTPEAEVK